MKIAGPLGMIEKDYPDAWRFVYGGCRGGDEAIAIWMTNYHKPKATHHVIIPANRSAVAEWWKYNNAAEPFPYVEYMKDGTDYKARNQAIVRMSDLLIAFPEYREEDPRSLRSGTWQTIRLAKKANIPVDVYILKED